MWIPLGWAGSWGLQPRLIGGAAARQGQGWDLVLLPDTVPQGERATEGWPELGDTELWPVGPHRGRQGGRTPGSTGAAGSGLRAPEAGGNLSPTAGVTPGNGTHLCVCESASSLGMLPPTQGHREARSRPIAQPTLYEELKAAGSAQGS